MALAKQQTALAKATSIKQKLIETKVGSL